MHMHLFCNTMAMAGDSPQSFALIDHFSFGAASSVDYHGDVSDAYSHGGSFDLRFRPNLPCTTKFPTAQTHATTSSQAPSQATTKSIIASPTTHQLYLQNTKLISTTINDTNYNYSNSIQLDSQHDRKHPIKEFVIICSLIVGFIASSMIAVCWLVSKKQHAMISKQKHRFERNSDNNLESKVQPFTRENVAMHDKLHGFSYNDYLHTKWHKHGSQYSLSLTLPSLDENHFEYSPDLDDQSYDYDQINNQEISHGQREWVDERVFDILKNERIELGIHKKVPKNERYATPRVSS